MGVGLGSGRCVGYARMAVPQEAEHEALLKALITLHESYLIFRPKAGKGMAISFHAHHLPISMQPIVQTENGASVDLRARKYGVKTASQAAITNCFFLLTAVCIC